MLRLHLPLRGAAADLVGKRNGTGVVHAAHADHVAIREFHVEVFSEPPRVKLHVVTQEAEQLSAGDAVVV